MRSNEQPVDIPSIEHRAVRKAAQRIAELEIQLDTAHEAVRRAETNSADAAVLYINRQRVIDDLQARLQSCAESLCEVEANYLRMKAERDHLTLLLYQARGDA